MASALLASSCSPSFLRSASVAHKVSPNRTPNRTTVCTASFEAQTNQTDPSVLVPRRCTLTELTFSDDGRLVTTAAPAPVPVPVASRSSVLVDLFMATIEASAQVKDLETLSGRLSMVAFFAAIVIEYATGSGVFSSIDQENMSKAVFLAVLSAVGAGAFAVAMRGKRNVTDILSSGAKRWMDSTVDSLVDALFFDGALVPHSSEAAEKSKR